MLVSPTCLEMKSMLGSQQSIKHRRQTYTSKAYRRPHKSKIYQSDRGSLAASNPNVFKAFDPTHCFNMAARYIVGSLAASFVVAYACDYIISDKKIFGGTIPGTVSNQEWFEETDKKFQAWPRVAGPPVVMNPISRQNFIVKSHTEA
ncbi:hypothetical protein QYF36_005700 [Acer negundo]|nr:hypothetical protein QYF36_005700 [Acer negundo]